MNLIKTNSIEHVVLIHTSSNMDMLFNFFQYLRTLKSEEVTKDNFIKMKFNKNTWPEVMNIINNVTPIGFHVIST